MNQQYLIFPLNKRRIQSLCFQNINATYIAICFSKLAWLLVVYFSFKDTSSGFHSTVNLCKLGKLPNLSNLNLKGTLKARRNSRQLEKILAENFAGRERIRWYVNTGSR